MHLQRRGGGSGTGGDGDAPSNNSQDADLDGEGEEEFHNGTDIGVATGTALNAAKSGSVVETETTLSEGSST